MLQAVRSQLGRAHRPLYVAHQCRAYAATNSASPASPKPAQVTTPKSSCAADTIMPGLNYLKGQAPVLALPDEEYPEWLWTVLSPKVIPDDGPGGKAERVQRRKENKTRIKERNFMLTQ